MSTRARARLSDFLPGRRDLRDLTRLAAPVATVQVGMMAMGVVDTIMVGHVSPVDLAAVALGNLYFFGVIVFGMGVLFALDPVISQAVGAGDAVGIARGVQRGAVLSGVLGVLASLLLAPAGWILTVLGQPPDVVPVAAGYALASVPGVFPFYLFGVLRQSLQAMGRVAPLLFTVGVANGANLLLNWVFIYGNLGVPAMGAVGSGWATSVSRWLMVAALVASAWRRLRPTVLPLRREALDPGPLGRMLRLGTPIGVQQLLEFGAFGATGLLMGVMGTVAMAGHQVALNLAALTFMVPLGVAQAATVLVGRAVGRGDAGGVRRAAGAGLLTGVAFMLVTALAFTVLPVWLARIYSSDVAVVAMAATLIPVAGLFQVFDGVQVVASGVLRGVGDTRAPMLIGLLGFWVVGLPVGLLAGFGFGAGPRGLWWGLAVGLAVTAALLLVRVGRRLVRELERVVVDVDAPGARAAEVPEDG